MYTLTEEQTKIAQYQGNNARILALAGTGKTTALIEHALYNLKHAPTCKILYLAYNKAMQLSAATKFPRNTTVKTIHSLAYSYCGHTYKTKLGNNRGFVINNALTNQFGELSSHRETNARTRIAVATLDTWLQSKDTHITTAHIPDISKDPKWDWFPTNAIGLQLIKNAPNYACWLWEQMKDLNNSTINMTHDGYLKLFALGGYQLPFDTILLDEAQDAQPLLEQIFQNQTHTRRIIVGDTHQTIYQWRNSFNLLTCDMTREWDVLTLNESFRFDQKVANLAAHLILKLKKEQINLIGSKSTPCSIQAAVNDSTVATKRELIPGACYLCRTRSGVFEVAITALSEKKKPHFIGGIQKYNFDLIAQAYNLYSNQKVTAPELINFQSWKHFTEYTEQGGEPEFKTLLKIINMHTHKIPQYLEELSKLETLETDPEAILITTAHSSKGLDWELVSLWDDWNIFQFFNEKNKLVFDNFPILPTELEVEANLLYVAVTRTKNILLVNNLIQMLLTYHKK